MNKINKGVFLVVVIAIAVLVISISITPPLIAQFDHNWKKEIDWAGRIYAGISHCYTGNQWHQLQDRLAESVGVYMRDHTVASDAVDYYPTAIKKAMLDIDAHGTNCAKVIPDIEHFRKKHGTYKSPK